MSTPAYESAPTAPRIGEQEPLVKVRGLGKQFNLSSGVFQNKQVVLSAVDDFSVDIFRGETLGLVGESGSGKSTIARLLLRLIEPTAGEVFYDGRNVYDLSGSDLRRLRSRMQIVFQDPFSSLNPRHSVGQIVGEGIETGSSRERRARVADLLDTVGLSQRHAERYPHEFSGGQRQRIGIARALAVEPEFLILDEPVSALDVSVQSKILNLLRHLKETFNLTYLFISHDLSVVKHIADRVAVLYLGQLMELATKDKLFESPLHPYTQALLSAVPTIGNDHGDGRIALTGEIPSPVNIPPVCRFVFRCFRSVDQCGAEIPELAEVESGHDVRCFNWARLEDQTAVPVAGESIDD